MKNILTLLAFIVGTTAWASDVTPPTKTINTSESVINWKGQKVTGSHTGTISIKEGNLEFDEAGILSGGSFSIDMATIKCTDLKPGGAAKLEGHLKSDDFFGVNNFPTANFEIVKVVSRGTPGSYKIIGNLTIKETTKEIRFNADISESSATADVTIDRTDYNVRYGSGSFFDNLGDKTIYDEFELNINLVF
jgi:polyisoprenoid-binding protein YceI